MQYMVIEKFDPGKVKSMYQRFAEKGRMLPEGVCYINSWINESVTTCFQLMECESPPWQVFQKNNTPRLVFSSTNRMN